MGPGGAGGGCELQIKLVPKTERTSNDQIATDLRKVLCTPGVVIRRARPAATSRSRAS